MCLVKVSLDYNMTEEEFLKNYAGKFIGWDFEMFRDWIRSHLLGMLTSSVKHEISCFFEEESLMNFHGRLPENPSFYLTEFGGPPNLTTKTPVVILVSGSHGLRLQFTQDRIEKPWKSFSESERVYVREEMGKILDTFRKDQWSSGRLMGASFIGSFGDGQNLVSHLYLVWYPTEAFS